MPDQTWDEASQPDAIDAGQAVVRAAVGSIPVLGSAATELFNFVITPPLEARRTEWMNTLAEDVDELKRAVEGFDPASLSTNDDFLAAVAVGVGAATRAAESEKRDALRYAVLNSALGRVPDFDMGVVFIGYLEYLTPLHLQLLKAMDDPIVALQGVGSNLADTAYMGGPSQVVEAVFPQLKREVYDFLWQDLSERRLVSGGGLHVMMSKDGMLAPQSSSLGKKFLAFIAEPPELGDTC